MSDRSRSSETPSSARPYREVTVAAVGLGVVVGILLTAAMTYAGLVIGFVVPASAIAAILGWGLLRGVLRRGTTVENNINQTAASAINITAAGVIFTFPALFLMEGVEFNAWWIAAAAVAGGFLGTLFIIPLRKQMIDLERLRFPSGTAVAEILRSPGAGVRKSALLVTAGLLALGFGLLSQFGFVPSEVDLGEPLGLPAYVPNVWALMLLTVGAGFISGRPGLVVLGGGILANWVLAPLVVQLDWVPVPAEVAPEAVDGYLAGAIFGQISRPLGIGFLMGGALAGVLLALPMLRAAFRSMAGAKLGASEELPVKYMIGAIPVAFVLLAAAAYLSSPDVGLLRALATAIIGTLWMWLAGIIVAQCTGLTDWSPVSGMALLAVTLILLVVGGGVGLAVLIGAAVCVAIGQGADMMSDQKTGFLVGSRPVRQQAVQLAVAWIGPAVSVITVYLIWEGLGFGLEANPDIPAPQAEVLKSMIAAIQGGDVPGDKYLVGALVGGGLTLATGSGLGVLVGLSMYLPMKYVLPYGLGCVLAITTEKTLGRGWNIDKGVPIAAGLLVGDALAGVVYSAYRLIAGVL
jgi:putative OPT family oligopeptide transporter